ncbi:hypothetical protein LTR37_003509 [Vermiconidia calcicola]|uniref:Uncharacterized protein n=1 Tax=Vermiconidia calcicola TaxID=1690605 RepID=A0ACC3NRD4_9PEZI|nr:hypothetical protein LTR37_003509 [Vermiconidia calcicola]
MVGREDLLVCNTCGTQFDVPADKPLKSCRICDDPRQFVPPSGQTWTSLAQMREQYKNNFHQAKNEERMWSIVTEPKFGIGQRCVLLQTPEGNVLWDCITYLDSETVETIKAKGGLKAIVISHPHYYTTHLDWAEAFDCPVYIAAEDEEWVCRPDPDGRRRLLSGNFEDIIPGVCAAKPGGHFPGSLVLSWDKKLFIADTFVTVPVRPPSMGLLRFNVLILVQSAYYHLDRPPGTTSYAFMWSIPNMLPLPPSELYKMWQVLKELDFESTHAAFLGTDIRDSDVKKRVLESMKIQAKCMGYTEHDILDQALP